MNRAQREAVGRALAGEYVPKVGDRGHWDSYVDAAAPTRLVEVTRVSDSGRTVWLRFVADGKPCGVDGWRERSNFFLKGYWYPLPGGGVDESVRLPAPRFSVNAERLR